MERAPGVLGLIVGLIAIEILHFSLVGTLSTVGSRNQFWTETITLIVGVVGGGLFLAHSIGSVQPNGVRGAGLVLGAFILAVASWELGALDGDALAGRLLLSLLAVFLGIGGGLYLAHAIPATYGTWGHQAPLRLLFPIGAILPILFYLVVKVDFSVGPPIRGVLRLALYIGLVDWFWAGLNSG